LQKVSFGKRHCAEQDDSSRICEPKIYEEEEEGLKQKAIQKKKKLKYLFRIDQSCLFDYNNVGKGGVTDGVDPTKCAVFQALRCRDFESCQVDKSSRESMLP